MAQLSCLICGADTGEVTSRLVEWREPIGKRTFESLPRCRDVDRCWDRVTRVLGEPWEVNDGRPIHGLTDPEPDPVAAAPTLEDPAWLTGEPAEASR